MKLNHNHKLHGDAINKTESITKKYGIVGTMAEYCRNGWPSIPLTHIYITNHLSV